MSDNDETITEIGEQTEPGEYIQKQLKKDTIGRTIGIIILVVCLIFIAPFAFVYGGWFLISLGQSVKDSKIENNMYNEMVDFTEEHREELTELSLDVMERLYYYSDEYEVSPSDLYFRIYGELSYDDDLDKYVMIPKCSIKINKNDVYESFDAPPEDTALLDRWCEVMGAEQPGAYEYMGISAYGNIRKDTYDHEFSENFVRLYQRHSPGEKTAVYSIDMKEYESGNISAGKLGADSFYMTPSG